LKLLSLRLKNFKGISGYTLDLRGSDATIKSDNAGGKTSIADAFYWLLTDKDSHNKKDFEIKTLDEYGQPLHGLDHEVAAEFSLPGGVVKCLQKTYREKWTKQRGKASATFSGHTVDHQIDGVPCKAGDFRDLISDISPEDILRLLTDPRHFNANMHWEARRALLLEVCGDVTDAEVIESNSELSMLSEILEGRAAAEQKKVILGRQKEIQKELDRIPTRIDETSYNLPDVEGVDKRGHEANIKSLQNKIEKMEANARKLQSDGGAADLENEIAILNAKMQNAVSKAFADRDKQAEPIREQLRTARANYDTAKRAAGNAQHEINSFQEKIASAETDINLADTNIKRIDAEQFTFEQSYTCPTCGQNLPADQLAEAREKALRHFNATKSSRLEKFREEQAKVLSDIKVYQEKIKEAEKAYGKADGLLLEYQNIADNLQGQLTYADSAVDINPEVNRMGAKKAKLESQLSEIETGAGDKLKAIKAEIAELQGEIRQSEKALAQIDHFEKGKKRIKELKDLERELAAEYEQLEQHLFMIEEFTRSKVKLLEDKINGRFTHARFKLFEEHINGGISETCVCLYGGVPYDAGLNAGHQIIVGLDIIATLADYYKFWPPVFVDNAESITDTPKMRQQVIKLFKPEIKTKKDRQDYKNLIVEVE
jgi:hypothetical protein